VFAKVEGMRGEAMRHLYEVIVGNIGTVHTTANLQQARRIAARCVKQSKAGVGRAGGEDITIMGEDQILWEYNAPRSTGGRWNNETVED
jgi:hypothetical protein